MEQTSYYQRFDVVVGPCKDKQDIYQTYLFRVEEGYVAAIPQMVWSFFISDVLMRQEGKDSILKDLLHWMDWESVIPFERAKIAAKEIVLNIEKDMKTKGK